MTASNDVNPPQSKLAAPFPYFGGKSRIAPVVWQALGDPDVYVEPFLGSAAVTLSRPHSPRREILNDADGFVINFWRSIQRNSLAVARACTGPADELELLARHRWICQHARKRRLLESIAADPRYYDPQIAGYWAWIMSIWIGSGVAEGVWHAPNDGRNHGTCIDSPKKPHLTPQGVQAMGRRDRLPELFNALSRRIEHAFVVCGDWKRCFIPSDLSGRRSLGIFLDPPYALATGRVDNIYRCEKSTTDDVHSFCRRHARRRNIRIVLAGFEGEYDLPGWRTVAWSKSPGYARTERGVANCQRERLWISPGCLPVTAPPAIASAKSKSVRWQPRRKARRRG